MKKIAIIVFALIIAGFMFKGLGTVFEGDNGGPGNGYIGDDVVSDSGMGKFAEGDNGGPGNGLMDGDIGPLMIIF